MKSWFRTLDGHHHNHTFSEAIAKWWKDSGYDVEEVDDSQYEVVGMGVTEDGREYVDYRITGTKTPK